VQAPFGAADVTAIVITRRADALAPARRLTRTVALVAVTTVCAVLLLSFHQVRRLLDPIAQLQEGTARIARGDFATRVEVGTGDELQELGDAFNRMAGDLQAQFGQLQALSVGTLEALARAIDAKSAWTAGHSTRVAAIAVATARALGLTTADQDRLYRGAMLHDIGKIGISAEILDKAGPLTPSEAATVAQHPELGERILEPLPHCADILPMVRHHHERLDGSGYPDGLAGDAIAFDARVLAVADSYDAMTSDRPYRRGKSSGDAAATLTAAAGTLFDPAVVEGFLEALRRGDIPAPAAADGRLDRTA
jgi:putative nucleotidyltransferase with HDIG domain